MISFLRFPATDRFLNSAYFFLELLILLAWAGPQWGTTQRTITPKGIDLLIAVDLSKSMLARDVRPNRLERVKLTLSNLLPSVRGDRLGLIAFSVYLFTMPTYS